MTCLVAVQSKMAKIKEFSSENQGSLDQKSREVRQRDLFS